MCFDVRVKIAAQTPTSGRVTEVPIAYRKRVGCQKLNSWKHGFQTIHSVFGLTRTYDPALLFSGLMALAVIPASFVLGWAVFECLCVGVAQRVCSYWFNVAGFGVSGLNCCYHIASVEKGWKSG